ncbi:MAG: hypothetical protein IJT41_09755 [Clostridia bacterium]|nr:hypothetical protein [Clostridia bacterium]
MKAAAAALIFTACLFAGSLARGSLRRVEQILSQLCVFLRRLRFCARLHRPLGAVIAQAADDPDLSALAFLSGCAASCRGGTALPQAWRDAVHTTPAGRTIERYIPSLVSLIPALASADGRQVDALLELYEAQARDALQNARQKSEHMGSVYMQLGGAVGILLGIMIL